MSTPLAVFGPGILIVQRTDIAVPSPVNVGYAQEFSIELAGQTKQLYGQKQYPLVAARSTVKASGKIKAAVFSGLAWNAMMFGENSFQSGGVTWNIDSTYSVPSTAAYAVTVQNSTIFEADLGVRYSTNGLPFQRVSTTTVSTDMAAGQYSAGSGVYTFAAADAAAAVKITYTTTKLTGQTLRVTNKDIGFTPTFQLDYYTNLNQPTSKPFSARVFAAIDSKLSLGFKLEDFAMPELEFDLFADNQDRIIDFGFPEVS